MKKLLGLILILTLTFFVFGCSKKQEPAIDPPTDEPTNADEPASDDETGKEEVPEEVDESHLPKAIITMQTGEKIEITLYPDIAPNTVNNFISLAESGYYNGLIFHRVIENFMIQGGDPLGNGTGGPGYSIAGEFTNNGFQNDLSHEKGVVSMARSRDMDSAGSQFFIVHENSTYLDGDYAAFGRVRKGMDVVDRIAMVAKDRNDMPLSPEQIRTIDIVRNGYVFDSVKKISAEKDHPFDDRLAKELPFDVATPMKNVLDAWGEADESDYFLGGLFYNYLEHEVLFFSDSTFDANNQVIHGEVKGLGLYGERVVLGVKEGMSFDEVEALLGTPDQLNTPQMNEFSELYSGSWTMTYETSKYSITFASMDDDTTVHTIYVFSNK